MGVRAERREARRARTEADQATAKVRTLEAERAQYDNSLDFLQERMAELELALEDEGWRRLGFEGERDFSAEGRRKIVQLGRLMYLKNPLIRRGVNVQTYYVMGQGVQISGRADTVNSVLQMWLNDPYNARVLTGHQGLTDRDRDLQVDGELFFAMFSNPSTGRVKTRTIHPDEITHIITNPDDAQERRFYRRQWQASVVDGKGNVTSSAHVALYPDMNYRPKTKPGNLDGVPIQWDTPVYYVSVGGLGGMSRGIPDFYAAMAFARAYQSFLEDWATIIRSLSRWAWKYTAGKRQSVEAIAQRLGTTVSDDASETNPAPSTGSVFVEPADGNFAPIPKSGATISADDGRQLRTMVAAAMDIPDSILANDPQQGALATAKTLDRPTELAMRDRQQLWDQVFKDLACFVIERSIVAPRGLLKGTVSWDENIITIALGLDPVTGAELDAGVDVLFPPILEKDVTASVGAIVAAATLEGKTLASTIPAEEVSRQLMSVLGVDNIDDAIAELFPDPATVGMESAIATFRAELKEYLAGGPPPDERLLEAPVPGGQ